MKPPLGAGCGEPVGLQGALPQRKELHLQVYRLSILHGDCTRGPGDFTRGLYQGTDFARGRRRTLWRSGIAATSVADPNQDLFFPDPDQNQGISPPSGSVEVIWIQIQPPKNVQNTRETYQICVCMCMCMGVGVDACVCAICIKRSN